MPSGWANPVPSLRITIQEYQNNELMLVATQSGQAREFSDRNLLRTFAAMPWATARIMVLIHWQALKIWLRGGRLPPEAQTTRTGGQLMSAEPGSFIAIETAAGQGGPSLALRWLARALRSMERGKLTLIDAAGNRIVLRGSGPAPRPSGTSGVPGGPCSACCAGAKSASRRVILPATGTPRTCRPCCSSPRTTRRRSPTSPNARPGNGSWTASGTGSAATAGAGAAPISASTTIWATSSTGSGWTLRCPTHRPCSARATRRWRPHNSANTCGCWNGWTAEPGAHILEIGCGWGGFAEAAARQGYRVTGITLSQEQLDYARERVARAGLSDRVELRLQDYRDLHGQYDHIVSIEMFEAVGEEWWPTYFDKLRECLRPGGRAALQVITIDEKVFPRYRESADFIQLYVFPGACCRPCPASMRSRRPPG
jgi:hypothetical protein